jgi:hypothetical protein
VIDIIDFRTVPVKKPNGLHCNLTMHSSSNFIPNHRFFDSKIKKSITELTLLSISKHGLLFLISYFAGLATVTMSSPWGPCLYPTSISFSYYSTEICTDASPDSA